MLADHTRGHLLTTTWEDVKRQGVVLAAASEEMFSPPANTCLRLLTRDHQFTSIVCQSAHISHHFLRSLWLSSIMFRFKPPRTPTSSTSDKRNKSITSTDPTYIRQQFTPRNERIYAWSLKTTPGPSSIRCNAQMRHFDCI
jgi:hypothetical protein